MQVSPGKSSHSRHGQLAIGAVSNMSKQPAHPYKLQTVSNMWPETRDTGSGAPKCRRAWYTLDVVVYG